MVTLIANQLSTKEEQQELSRTFKQFDRNGDGFVDRAEFIKVYQKVYQNLPSNVIETEANMKFD